MILFLNRRTDAVFFDPASGAVLGQRTAHELAATERIVHTVDPLHFGTFGGLITKIIWAIFGLGLTFLAGSGAYIYAKRVKLAVREGINLSVLDYLGRWRWPSLAVITVVPLVSFLLW